MSQGDFLSKVFMKELNGEITYECPFIYSRFVLFWGGGGGVMGFGKKLCDIHDS